MPIKKRLSTKQRLNRQLPKGWRNTLQHPIMKKLIYDGSIDTSTESVVAVLKSVKGWKGASWREKVFILALDLIMEKSTGKSLLDPDAYNRLQDHLTNNEHKMYADNTAWMTYIWDIYHDHYKLQKMETGDLRLDSKPKLKITKKKPKKIKLKRRRK